MKTEKASARYKEDLNGNFRMEKYNSQNKKLTQWTQQQIGSDEGKRKIISELEDRQ